MTIHMYTKGDSGAIRHQTTWHADLSGNFSVAGPPIELKGWPTPAMRQAVTALGQETNFYIGTDVDGSIASCK